MKAREPEIADVQLTDVTADQEHRFTRAFALIDQAIAERTFPGAALAVTLGNQLLALRAFGHLTYDPASPAVVPEAIWDLASLTKPIATVSMAMLLYERGKLPLEAPIVELLPEFTDPADPWRKLVTVRMLLEHSSGLPAHRKLYLQAHDREAMLKAAARVPLDFAPGQHAEYSDIGFILLGELLERIALEREDVFCQREIFDALKLNFRFAPHPIHPVQFPPTAIDNDFRRRVIQGEVNDENASAMGGVAGHAGAFGDVLSVARFAHCILRGGHPLWHPESVRLFTTRATLPPGTSRAMGWDTPSLPSQSGTHFSPRSFGHLGYTGTSLWCDPERQLSITLLTNRTWPNATNQAIKEVRPRVHDAVVECVES